MATVSGSAALAARAVLAATAMSQRITVAPGTVLPGTGVTGPIATSSWVQVPAVADGVYDT
jgi:hypothetical protein